MKQDITFGKERGVKGCVVDCWKIFALDWRHYLKNLWVYLLLVGMTGAFAIEMLFQYGSEQALPAYRLFQMDGNPLIVEYLALPSWSTLLYILLSVVLFLVASYCCAGRLVGLIRHYASEEKLPEKSVLVLSKEERQYGRKLFVVDALCSIVFLLVSAIVVYAAVKWSGWIAVVLPFWGIYMWTTSNVARLQYALHGKKMKEAFRFALKKSLGNSLLVQILTWIPAVFLFVLCLLSVAVYFFSLMASSSSVLMDDVSKLPASLPFLFFVLNTIGLSMSVLVNTIRTWALAMK